MNILGEDLIESLSKACKRAEGKPTARHAEERGARQPPTRPPAYLQVISKHPREARVALVS
jgi:hypothetical protein